MAYGHLERRVSVALSRLGKTVRVLNRETSGTNGFNNPDETYSGTNMVTVFRTYPNRNTETKGLEGDLKRDRPLFVFEREDAPDSNARIEYPEDTDSVTDATETTLYELQAPTRYDTHVEIFGETVDNP